MFKKILTLITLLAPTSITASYGTEATESTGGLFETDGNSEKASPQKWRGPVPMWDDPD